MAFWLFMSIVAILDIGILEEDNENFARESLVADGVVVQHTQKHMTGQGERYSSNPVVVFQTADGQTVQFEDKTALDQGLQNGQKVKVRYMPNQPTYAVVDDSTQQTNDLAIHIMFVVLTIAFLACAILSLRGIRRAIGVRKAMAQAQEAKRVTIG